MSTATEAEHSTEAALSAIPAGSIARQVLWLALPVLIEQSLLYLVGFSDTVLTGRYLADPQLAAVTVASYLIWFLQSMMVVVSAGATALIARLIGGAQREAAIKICGQSIALGWIVGLAVTCAGLWAAPAIIALLRLKGIAAQEAVAFLRIVLIATPLVTSLTTGVACLRGAGDTRTGMWVMMVVNAINVSLSWSLVTGLRAFPSFGLRGVATGTAIGEGIGGLIVLIVLARGRSGLKLHRRHLVPETAQIWRILRISLPAAGESLSNSICQLWFLSLINHLGETATAAHGVAIRCESLSFLSLLAFSVAASTLTGQYLGARRPELAAKAASTAWAMGVVTMSVMGVIIYVLARPMFAIFLGHGRETVIELGVPVLRIVAFGLPALATINVLNGALRGAGDTRWPWVIVLCGYLLVRMPMTYYLTWGPEEGGLGWGLRGAWIAMFADLCFRGSLVAARYLHGGWKKTRV
jgi:putative MATE family efflux protein